MSLQTCFIHNRLNQERWTNHIYKNKRGRVHTSFSHPNHFIIYHHYCLSVARPNDVKIIIVQECRGLRWNLQTFYSTGEDKVKWALISSTVIQMRATQHFHDGLLLSTPKEKKRNKTIYTGKLPTSKRRTRNLFGFSF